MRIHWAGVVVWFVACTNAPSGERAPRESTPRLQDETSLGIVQRVPAFQGHFGKSTYEATPRGFEPIARPGWARTALAVLPARGGDAARLETSDEAWIEVSAVGDEKASAIVRSGALLTREVALDTDTVHLAEHGRIEELRVLRSSRAAAHTTYELRFGPALSGARVRDGRVEVLDHTGRVRFATERAYAVDATGREVPVRVTAEHLPERDLIHTAVDTAGLAFPVVVDPAWVMVASLSTYRSVPAAVTLADGRVLVIGGNAPSGPLPNSEVYSEATKKWTVTGNNVQPRAFSSAARLPSGKALVAFGGGFSSVAFTTAEIYDPATNNWTAATLPPVGAGGNNSAAIALSSGKILITGGGSSSASLQALLYDEVTKWTKVADMKVQRESHTMALLPGGKVLAMAGVEYGGGASTSAEIYDPVANTWTLTPKIPRAHDGPFQRAVSLKDGRVLLVGGYTLGAELYDPVANTWTSVGTTLVSRTNMVTLGTGRVLVSGGAGGSGVGTVASAELFDPVTATWSSAGTVNAPRSGAAVALLPSGAALFAGGSQTGFGFTAYLDDAETFTQGALAATCMNAWDCQSGFCVDGVCCNSACAGACQACDVTAGTCTNVVTGPPHGARTCGSYVSCTSGACATSCTTDAACATGYYCKGTTCTKKDPQGTACTSSAQCLSGACNDGVCCDRLCGSICEACDLAGKVGTCTNVAGAPHPSRGGCGGVGAGMACGATCDGLDGKACHFPASGTPACGADACTAGVESHLRTCNGAGACNDVPVSCGAYACGPIKCKTTCATSADCAPLYTCDAGACKPPAGIGSDCSATKPCASPLSCVDGVCCTKDACAAGETCAYSGKKGTCTKPEGTACTAGLECGSGVCADGVCCDRACNGQCEACDVKGKSGKCSPSTGAPHGARTACGGGTDACGAKSCDGVATDSCKALPAKTVECAAASCVDGTFTAASTCDGAGVCAKGATTTCAPFACAGTTACRTTCVKNEHCAAGYRCADGKCLKSAAVCTEDGLGSISADGKGESCQPYRCDAATQTCRTSCTTSDHCAPGSACADGACVAAAAAAADGGCAHGAGSSGGAWLFIVLALAAARPRSRKEVGR